MNPNTVVRPGQWNVVGHQWAVDYLQRSLGQGRLGHAYLFLGPRQVGKRSLALEFARTIHCQGETRPCGECRSCQFALRGRHPGIETIRGEGTRGALLVEQVRALRRSASLSTPEGHWRVYILCDMESANESASNALLKTLEEPPAHVILLLTATSEELLPATIVSRCQIVMLRQGSRHEIQKTLEARWGVAQDTASLLAHLSGGCMGRALHLIGSEEHLARRSESLEQLHSVLVGDNFRRFTVASTLAKRPETIPEILEVWLSWWHDVLLSHAGLPERHVNLDCSGDLLALRTASSCKDACSALKALQECTDHIQKNVSCRLALEQLMLRLPVNLGDKASYAKDSRNSLQ